MTSLFKVYYYWTEHGDSSNCFEEVIFTSVNEEEARKWYLEFNPQRKVIPPYTVISPGVKTLIKTSLGEKEEETQLEQHNL